ncbi:MAG: EamA family transporter [Gemmatimonadaceae bacterium]|nr:EamA family transporter [Gemmatimonadaceae bacterium]
MTETAGDAKTVSSAVSGSTGVNGTWLIVAAAFQWAMLGPMARVAFAEGVPSLTVAFWRATLAALLFAAHSAFTRAPALHRTDRPRAILLGVLGMALLYVAYFNSVQHGGAALAAILLYSAPIWVAVGAHTLLGERVSRTEVGALSLTLIGVVLVALSSGDASGESSGSSSGVSYLALMWGVLSGLSYAGYFLLGRPLFARNTPSRVLTWVLIVTALVLLPFAEWQFFSLKAWGALAFLAAIGTFGAYLCNATGLRTVPTARAATIATLEPVLAVGAAYLVWGETLAPLGLFGGALVVLGVVLSARGSRGGANVRERDVRE